MPAPRTELGALYYPYHPKDGAWLRHALLYHDYVATTIPRILLGEPEFQVPDYLKTCADENLYRIATDSIPGEHVALTQKIASIDDSFAFAGMPLAEDFSLRIMLDPNFVARDIVRNESFLFADILATATADLSSDLLIPSTDIERSFRHLYGEQPPGNDVRAGLYMTLWNVFPSPGVEADLKDIVKFRLKRSDELLRLRSEMAKIRESIGKAADREGLKQVLHGAQAAIGSAVADLRSALGSDFKSSISTTVRELVTTQPAAIGGISAVAGSAAAKMADAPIEYVVGGAIVAAVTGLQAAFFRTRAERKKLLRQSPHAYLYLAEKAGIVEK